MKPDTLHSILAPAAKATSMEFAGQISLCMDVLGEGDDVYVGLHGWGGSLHTFDPLAPYLPPGIRLVRLSLPGYGGSPYPLRWDLPSVVDMISANLAYLKTSKVTLVGNCSGAIFGMLALQKLSLRLDRLILIDAFAYMPWYLRILLTPLLGHVFYWSSFGNPLGRVLTNRSLRKHQADDTDLMGSFAAIDHYAAYQTLRLLGKVGSYQQFANVADVDTKVDLIYGAKSFSAIHQSVAMWEGLWPQAQRHALARGGHLPLEEATAEVVQILWGGAC